MKNVIITGATSFIGLDLVQRLLNGPYRIFAIVRPNARKANLLPKTDRIRIVEAEMSEYIDLHKKIAEPCDIYFSLAWQGTRGREREDRLLQQDNYQFSMEALYSILALGCNTVISAGSQAEYGQYNAKIDEDTQPKPVTQYGKFKLKFFEDAFNLCIDTQVHFKEPRFFSLYGAGDYEGTMIVSTIRKMLENKDCKLTRCIQMWDFLYISDAVEGLISLIEKPCSEGAYNFGSGDSRPLKEFIQEMHIATKSSGNLLFGSIPYPSSGMVSIEPDISKLVRETQWSPRVTFLEGIEKIIDSIRRVYNEDSGGV